MTVAHVPVNNIGKVGAICNVEVAGEQKKYYFRCIPSEVMEDLEVCQQEYFSMLLKKDLPDLSVRLLSFRFYELPDRP